MASGLRYERFALIVVETRDPFDPTSPRREASLFNSPGPVPGVFLCPAFFAFEAEGGRDRRNAAGWGKRRHRTPIDVEVPTPSL